MNAHPKGEQISAYVDGMLDLNGMRVVAGHLRECDRCRNAFEALLETKALLHQAPKPLQPPAEFWVNAYRTIRVQERESQLQNTPLLERWSHAWTSSQKRWASGAAAAAALCILAFSQMGGPATGPVGQGSTRPAVSDAADVVDFNSLVHAHTQSVALQPLADPDRQAMISADNETSLNTSAMEASVNADSSL